MVGALIGEAFISASIQVICDRIASPEFIDLFRHKKLDQPLLMKLKRTLLTLNAVLDDAEEKQIEKPAVREWLDDLKHAVFDAEDLLDEINYEALRCKLEGEAQNADKFTTKVWNFLPTSRNKFYQSMNVKIQELLRKLEDFVQLKGALGLTEVVGRKVSQRTPTTSLVHEPFVYGRDEVKENLSKVLFSDDASKEDVSVITIVGMGGVGKTTLARMLYNDDKVKEHFTFKAWACVSEDYDAIRVTKTLLESVTSKPCNTTDLNLLQVELREQLRGKKFLFVLDDLWNEKYTDWNCLQTPFTSGARGSKVIVTTRNKNVASFMQNVPTQPLEPLSHEHCWLLLAKHAFRNVSCSAYPSLEEIGKKIARKCNGLPLAAQTLGGLLRSRLDIEVWNRVLNNSIWELPYEKSDILPALGLSYHYLPAKLKRCFIYCSILPKDYEFKVEDVVFLWMGEGLIPQSENGERMEEIAKEYFDELLSRSLFQTSGKSSFVMHDLINDLAVFMSKGFCSRWEGRELHEVERVRHLSYAREYFDVALKFEPLKGAKCLRTFLPTPLNTYQEYYLSKKFVQDLLLSHRCLRVLSLSRYRNVTQLPDSIKNLIHLRYLDLSRTTIERLPGVVCSLYNLQTLLLSNCSSLIELPVDFRKLTNLQKLMLGGCRSLAKLPIDLWKLSSLYHLDVSGTKITKMPSQMSRLKSLRTLTAFVVGKSTGSTTGELGELPHLRGKLSILNLQNVVDAKDAVQANLKNKKYLKELKFGWGDEDSDDSEKVRDVLDKLQPSISLEKLTIQFYGGTNFPNWLGDSCFSNIQVMRLSDCKYCWSLPPVGGLPALKELYIERMNFVKIISVEFYGRNGASLIQPFQSLEKLEFRGMAEWEEWVPSGSGGLACPRLQELILEQCPKLRGSLPCDLPCLKKLRVGGCGVLHDQRATATTSSSTSLNYNSLEELNIRDKAGLLSLLETKLLSVLDISCFNGIQCLPNINRLQKLILLNCPMLSSFPEDGLPTSLTSLTIVGCRILEFLPQEMLAKLTSLDSLRIHNSCDSMRSFPLGIFPKLTTLEIGCCDNLISLCLIEEGAVLSHLNRMWVSGCRNLVCFPQGGLPTPNLTCLQVDECKKLKSLPKRIHTLTALGSLHIRHLPNLESIAEDGGLPPNLRYFSIQNCERLRASSSSVGDYCNWGLQALVSLERFTIGGRGSDEIMETLLKQQLLPTTLRTLWITELSTLKSLDGKGLAHLTFLRSLNIGGRGSAAISFLSEHLQLFCPGEKLSE
ncbi:putative disease resistance RPP13-like protein 1 [Prunus avium]|uniref:Disease resistance RPP13-like protein 1 n=1 Tax=Prunus avium TaxID=42229 RepID=A0A6P5T9Y9_PRUAV|nr:putative disease resistance RPP13-like protein 1 [Prunus avium]